MIIEKPFTISKWRSMGRHFFLIIILGFICGLPFSLLGTTLSAWFTSENVSVVTISLLALVHQPYAYKFVWAPLLDYPLFKMLDRRRGWILFCQFLLAIGIITLSYLSPQAHTHVIAIMALVLAFISATQDIAIDAYRAEILTPKERGLGATIAILSYRIANIVSGALALILADKFGWQNTFVFLAFLSLPCCLVIFFIQPNVDEQIEANEQTPGGLLKTLKSLWDKPQITSIVAMIFLYKLGEAFTSTSSPIMMPFLMQALGFSLSVVGTVAKGLGLFAVILGGIVSGALLLKANLYRCLYIFAVLQIMMNALFVILSLVGKNFALLCICIFGDNFVAGMGMTALVAFMMGICDKKYTATQFAFLSAVSALPRLLAGAIGGIVQLSYGWTGLFIISVLTAVPVLVALRNIKLLINDSEKE